MQAISTKKMTILDILAIFLSRYLKDRYKLTIWMIIRQRFKKKVFSPSLNNKKISSQLWFTWLLILKSNILNIEKKIWVNEFILRWKLGNDISCRNLDDIIFYDKHNFQKVFRLILWFKIFTEIHKALCNSFPRKNIVWNSRYHT